MGGKDKKNTGPLDIADSRIYIYQDGKEINTNRAGSPISISVSISILPAYSDGPAASPASAHTHTPRDQGQPVPTPQYLHEIGEPQDLSSLLYSGRYTPSGGRRGWDSTYVL